ncbi:MAG TPA: cytochrome c oxidase subunit 4 [Acidimicrobiales bacterium]|nr:cytochrome c oxidase subunit 4 [Acidimicrobiales bacterium]
MSDDEAVTAPNVAEEEGQRDDAGRSEGAAHAGWATQARLFGTVGAFIVAIAVLYWFVSYEHAGATLLALAAVVALMTAAYVAWPRGGHAAEGGGEDGGRRDAHQPGHDPHDGVWFPEASIWPFAVGAAMALVVNGLLLGRWLVIPAGVFLAWAVAGLIRQGRHRI